MQEAVVADTTKALWQNVLQHEPQEVFSGQGARAGLTGSTVEVSEGHWVSWA